MKNRRVPIVARVLGCDTNAKSSADQKISRASRSGTIPPPPVRSSTHVDTASAQTDGEALRAIDRWLDLIADLIADDMRNEEPRDADALRGVRTIQ